MFPAKSVSTPRISSCPGPPALNASLITNCGTVPVCPFALATNAAAHSAIVIIRRISLPVDYEIPSRRIY